VNAEYVGVGVVLALLGGAQIWVRRRGWEGEEAQRWTALLGPAAIVMGLALVAAGLLDW